MSTQTFFLKRYGFGFRAHVNGTRVTTYIIAVPEDDALTKELAMVEGEPIRIKGRVFSGQAKCNPEDKFDSKTGLELAIFRAIKAYANYDMHEVVTKHVNGWINTLDMIRRRLPASVHEELKEETKNGTK